MILLLFSGITNSCVSYSEEAPRNNWKQKAWIKNQYKAVYDQSDKLVKGNQKKNKHKQ